MGNRDPQPKKKHTTAIRPDAIIASDIMDRSPDDDDDDDEDDDDDDVDDREVADLERERCDHTIGRSWVLVSETDESMTYVMEVGTAGIQGCLVRVKAWGLHGEPMMSVVFVPGLRAIHFADDPITDTEQARLDALRDDAPDPVVTDAEG